jgi:hypothetical protein
MILCTNLVPFPPATHAHHVEALAFEDELYR